MNKNERVIRETQGPITKISRVSTIEITVPYGRRERISEMITSTRLNRSPRTLTNKERRDLREKNRVGGRINPEVPTLIDGEGIGLEPMIVFKATNVK